jgi:predicted RNase H-related nuclease YkuK (DUF458 family)
MLPYNVEEVKKAIEESSDSTAIYVGCDSRRFRAHGRWFATYTTVVVIHVDQCRGCIIYGKRDLLADFGKVKERMLNEVNFAVAVAYQIADSVGDRRFEIHLDVNPDPKHKSSLAVKEALGYVQGMGFVGRIKPDAPIASTAADFFGKARVNVPKEFLNG